MNDPAWINAALISARPQAIAALLRYFRDMDTAEEAYQEACLRALKNWTQNGPPRDPANCARTAHRFRAQREANRARISGERERHGAADHAGQGVRGQSQSAVRDSGRGGTRPP